MENKLVSVKNLNKSFGKRKVLDNITFEMHRKEIVGFIGPNGAGKSTTMKCLCNLVIPDSGEILINGHDIFREREKALACQASLIENPGLYSDMTGYENIKLIAKLRQVSKSRMDEIITFSHLGKAINMKVIKYSLGMKQRLGLSIALLSKPQFLILDEPTNGLDPTGILELRNTLQELVKNEGISILFSSHQLGEIEKLADRILCINGGKLLDIPELMKQTADYMLMVEDVGLACQVLSEFQECENLQKVTNNWIHVSTGSEGQIHEILNQLIQKGVRILDVNKVTVDIELIYKQVYGEKYD